MVDRLVTHTNTLACVWFLCLGTHDLHIVWLKTKLVLIFSYYSLDMILVSVYSGELWGEHDWVHFTYKITIYWRQNKKYLHFLYQAQKEDKAKSNHFLMWNCIGNTVQDTSSVGVGIHIYLHSSRKLEELHGLNFWITYTYYVILNI